MHKKKRNSEEFTCVDAEVGSSYLDGYVMESLSDKQRQEFEDHLVFCLPCQEELAYRRWLLEQFHHSPLSSTPSPFFFEIFSDKPLPATSILTAENLELIHDYQGKPMVENLAASTDTSGELIFPITIAYVDGQVIGQFHTRAGQLFYVLKKSTIGDVSLSYTLIYTSPSNSNDIRTFQLREDQATRLGAFQEFVSSNTLQGRLNALKQFQLVIKTPTNSED